MDIINKKDEKIDHNISRFVVSYYMIEAINMTIKSVFPISEQMWTMMSNGFILLLALLLAVSIRPVLNRTHRAFIMTELIFAVLFIISFLQGNATPGLLMATAFRTLGVTIPLAFYVLAVKDKRIFYDTILRSSYVLIVMLSFVFIMNKDRDYFYTMSVSYALLLPTILQINELLKRRRLTNLIFTTIAILGIMFYGARGPLVSIGAFLVLKYLISPQSVVKKSLVALLGITLIGLMVVYADQLGDVVLHFLQSKGIYSRSIYSLVKGRFLDGSGRDRLFAYYLDLARMKPFVGWGLKGGWIGAGSGPHNMLIELLLALGYIGGGLLSIVASALMFRVFFIKDPFLQELVAIFAACNVVLFFVSGNVLEKVNWFILVALVLMSFRAIKNVDYCTGRESLDV